MIDLAGITLCLLLGGAVVWIAHGGRAPVRPRRRLRPEPYDVTQAVRRKR